MSWMPAKVVVYVVHIGGNGRLCRLVPARVVEYVVHNGKRVDYVIDTGEYGWLRR